jgi:hypothetical protein
MFFYGPDGAPRPRDGIANEAGSNRVREDVLEGGLQVLFVVNHPGREALGEKRPAAAVASVVLTCVVAL